MRRPERAAFNITQLRFETLERALTGGPSSGGTMIILLPPGLIDLIPSSNPAKTKTFLFEKCIKSTSLVTFASYIVATVKYRKKILISLHLLQEHKEVPFPVPPDLKTGATISGENGDSGDVAYCLFHLNKQWRGLGFYFIQISS